MCLVSSLTGQQLVTLVVDLRPKMRGLSHNFGYLQSQNRYFVYMGTFGGTNQNLNSSNERLIAPHDSCYLPRRDSTFESPQSTNAASTEGFRHPEHLKFRGIFKPDASNFLSPDNGGFRKCFKS
jgi:hypothetical protein